MKKILIILLICFFPALSYAGDSLLVAIRTAENVVGTNPVPDSIWTGWANDGYQICLADGYALLKQALIYIKPYAFADSDNYALPSNFYSWGGARVVSGDNENQRDIKLVMFGQGEQLQSGYKGRLEVCTINDDSIQFFPHPVRYDTVLVYYYATDGAKTDTQTMSIPKCYTPLIADYMISRFYEVYENITLAAYYRDRFEKELERRTILRRQEKADLILMKKQVTQ